MLYFLFCFAGPMFLFLGFHAVLHHSVSTDKDCQRKWSSTQDTTQGVRLWNQMKEKGSDSGDFQHRRVNLGDTSIQGKDHFNRCFIYPSSAVLSSLLTALVGE